MAENAPTGGRHMPYTERGAGKGDPVVLLHAFPLHGGMWELRAMLEGSRRVIALDKA